MTWPNTTCFPSNLRWTDRTLMQEIQGLKGYCQMSIRLVTHQSVFSVHMKNWEPFEFGPLFAMERIPLKRDKFQWWFCIQKEQCDCCQVNRSIKEDKYLDQCVSAQSFHHQIFCHRLISLLCHCGWWNRLLEASTLELRSPGHCWVKESYLKISSRMPQMPRNSRMR